MTICSLLAAGALSACTPERAQLEVELVPPVASRFVVHGNCFAGWYMVVDIVVHERRQVSVGALNGSVDAPDISGSIVVISQLAPGRVDPAGPAAKRVMENGARSTGEARPRTRPATISPMSGPIRMPLR